MAIRTDTANKTSKMIAPFLCLLFIEIITFGINAKHVGIYQDEWISFEKLHFVTHSLSQLIGTFLMDPRVIVRPLEALHFAPIFYFVWENPLWYHIICYISEFFAGWFLFLALCRFTRDPVIALATAIIFLLYPTHDVTHYEIVASSLSVSMAFFTASLWLYLKGLDENRFALIYWSGFSYFLSIINYEFCLPLVILYPLLYLLHSTPLDQWQKFFLPDKFKTLITYQIPFLLVVVAMLVYRYYILPSLGLGWHYATTFSCANFFGVIWSGLIVSLSPYTFQFCASMFLAAINEGLSSSAWIALSVATLFTFICLSKEKLSFNSKNTHLSLVFLGIITMIFSYTIYGLSPEHKPVIDAWLNRVNVGASLGACFVIIGCTGLILSIKQLPFSNNFKQIFFAAFISIFASSLIIIDWQFAKPWIVSWQTQKALIRLLKEQASTIRPGDSIIIGGIIRYASRWVPVVDGHWDFESIARTTLNTQQIKATVVTERLTIAQEELVDKYGNIILGKYPFKQMILFSPSKFRWVRISSRQEFIETAKQLDWNIPIESKY